MSFKFELGECVAIETSTEVGSIIARAEYLTGQNQYLIRYKNGNGVAVECFWGEDALVKTIAEN